MCNQIAANRQRVGTAGRTAVWQAGWQENWTDFEQGGYATESLLPRYIRPGHVLRLNQKYVVAASDCFERDFRAVFTHWLYETYFSSCDTVYEFGCGTGYNLLPLLEMYPEKRIYGSDFVPSSVAIINKLGQMYAGRVGGFLCDLTAPNEDLHLRPGSLVFTFGALEQLAGRFQAFLDLLLREKPELCVFVEPLYELYDSHDPVDRLAMELHERRGYTRDLLPCLQDLDRSGKIKVGKARRLFFGSTYMEVYSYIVWRPTP
jgi:hypothetical protein